jgi:flagellar export protein FliJ
MNRKFRLASVRERQRDEAAGKVGEINRAIEMFQAQIDDVHNQLQSLTGQRKQQSAGLLDVSELLDLQRYEMQLNLQLGTMRDRMKLLEKEKERRDHALMIAQQNLKAIEHLETQHFERLKVADAKALQSRLDEWTATNHIRTTPG